MGELKSALAGGKVDAGSAIDSALGEAKSKLDKLKAGASKSTAAAIDAAVESASKRAAELKADLGRAADALGECGACGTSLASTVPPLEGAESGHA